MKCVFGCQVCLTRYFRLTDFRKHIYSILHKEKVKEIFQIELANAGMLPNISVLHPQQKANKKTIIGLSLLTFCFNRVTNCCFYFCHVCEEKCVSEMVVDHLTSDDHYINYFSYTNPDTLSFPLIPGLQLGQSLEEEVKMAFSNGPEQLQMLELPVQLLEELKTRKNSEVMSALNENDKLQKKTRAIIPKRKMIQAYQKDSSRKYPLLGMQHVVECISVGSTEKQHYLCTLCQLSLGVHMIIKHVLSFDHIHSYFTAYHPFTLRDKNCYQCWTDCQVAMILDFAKQTEKIYASSNTDMKQVRLEPDEFRSVNFDCYAEALERLESIMKEKNEESSLIADIKPGIKLETLTARYVSSRPGSCPYSLFCQALDKYFSNGPDSYGQTGRSVPFLGLYDLLKKQEEPVVGLSLVVTLISSEGSAGPFYLCFACEETFPESGVRHHFSSHKHIIQTLLYLNPWRLPFAWEGSLDVNFLMSVALKEEEGKNGSDAKMLKMFDMPLSLFISLLQISSNPNPYQKVMASLQLQHTVIKQKVPRRETYSKLEQNERFPLLGREFIVMYRAGIHPVGFLCLLCERRLVHTEYNTHFFSREHISAFLNHFHPGSLVSSADTATILDLAKQAGRFHSIRYAQVITLMRPIVEPYSYPTATFILQRAKWRNGKGYLKPPIKPKMKLVPREISKSTDRGNGTDKSLEKSQLDNSEKQTSQKSTDDNGTTIKNVSVTAAVGIITTSAESSGHVKIQADGQTTPNEKESERRTEMFPEKSLEVIKSADNGIDRVIKKEKQDPSEDDLQCPPTTDVAGEAHSAQGSNKDSQKQWKNAIYKGTQRCSPINVSSAEEPKKVASIKPKEETTSEGGGSGETSRGPAEHEETSNVNHEAATLWQYIKIKIKNREPAIGLCSLLECHCDQRVIYLCECCLLMIPEKDIIGHVTGVDHQRMYLQGLQKLPPGKQAGDIRSLAALFEQEHGQREAQVVNLGAEIYSSILKQNPKSAIQEVRALLAQQSSLFEPLPSSAASAVQPVHHSIVLHPQHEVPSITDGLQVEDMDISESEDTEAQPFSVNPASTVTPEIHLESNGDVTKTVIRVSEPALDCNTSLAVSETSVDSHTSTSRPENATQTDTVSKEMKKKSTSQNKPMINSDESSSATSVTLTSQRPAMSHTSTSTRSAATASPCTTTTPPTSTSNETCKGITHNSTGTSTSTTHSATDLTSSTSSKMDETLKCSDDTSQTMVTSSECESTAVSSEALHGKNSAGPKNNSPHQRKPLPVRSEKQNPSVGPSCRVPSKTKPSRSLPKLGLNYLIQVIYDKKRQIYCQLCSIRLAQSGRSHLHTFDHNRNYVTKMCPGWSGTRSQMEKFEKTVAHLAELEKDVGVKKIQTLQVKEDVYSELGNLPQSEALERLKEMLNPLCRPSSTTEPAEYTPISSCEASSPDDLPVSDSEVTGRHARASDTRQEAAKMRRHSESQVSKTALESSQKALPDSFKWDTLPSAASRNTEPQNQSRPNQKAAHEPASPTFLGTRMGKRSQGPSRLSVFLRVQGLESQPVIGLGSVWECQGIELDSFYLCESCKITTTIKSVHGHMTSLQHRYNFLLTKPPEFLRFLKEDLLPCMKMDIFQDVVKMVSKQELSNNSDAQVILLRQDWHEHVRTATFSEALKIVKNIDGEENQDVSFASFSAVQPNDQRPEENLEETLITEKQSTPEANQRGHSEATQKAEKPSLEETMVTGDVNEDKQSGLTSTADSVVAPLPVTDSHHSPQENSGNVSMKPQTSPPACRHQSPISELQPEQGHSESPTSSVCRGDESPPNRKRAAASPPESLVSPNAADPQVNDPPAAKRRCTSPQPISQFSTASTSQSKSVCHAATSTSPPPKTEEEVVAVKSEELDASYLDWERCESLKALLRQVKSERNMSAGTPCPDNANTPHGEGRSETALERRWDSKGVQTTCSMITNDEPAGVDSKPPVMNAAVEHVAPSKPAPAHVVKTEETEAVSADFTGRLQPSPAETKNAASDLLPISPIITPRPDPGKYHVKWTYHEANKVNPNNAVAASGSYGSYSQVSCPTNGQTQVYFPPESVGLYRTTDNSYVYTGNPYQLQAPSSGTFYPSQSYLPQEASCIVQLQTPPGYFGLGAQQQYYASNQALYLGRIPFSVPTQRFPLNNYRINTNALTQSCNIGQADTDMRVQPNPPGLLPVSYIQSGIASHNPVQSPWESVKSSHLQ
ncbi:uncharacterized protein [Antennarius striatus]|uniref:uncharacterized protein isoform X2 n=1 Tax=Antennarius striatus TaxID=241820 RepID=UPI0035B1AE25